ncbi:MAG: tetratricopeptide repeat protein [Ignavibacteriaceae bacterium]
MKIDFAFPWHGLGNVYSQQKEYLKAIEAYQKAIQLDDKYSSPWFGLGNVYSEQKEYLKAIEAYQEAIRLDDNDSFSWYGLGNVHYEQKEYLKAIEAYQKAIQLDDKYSSPWYGIGNVYYKQKEHLKAIEAYQKSIKLDANEADQWNGLGNAYAGQKEYQKAIEAYQKAIKLDGKYFFAWHGLGNLYFDQKDFQKAIDSYLNVIKINNEIPGSQYNLGLVYRQQHDLVNAKKYFGTALKLFRKEGKNYWSSLAEKQITEIKISLNAEKELKKAARTSDSIIEVLNKTDEFENLVFENQKMFLRFFEYTSGKDDGRTYLKVLRRWNSYTPIIADNFHISKGGGYFLKINGAGIVIDPGFNFIENFKGSNYKFDEIDFVIASHAHNDHTSDIESIITLLNKCNSKRKGLKDNTSEDTVRADIAKRKDCKLDEVKEDDIEREFIASGRRKKIEFYLTKSTEKKYTGMLGLHSKHDYNCHIIEAGDTKEIKDKNDKTIVSFKVLRAKHDDVISDKDSVGFVFNFDNTILVYTGDSGWSADIEKQYKEIKENHKEKEIILLAHIGGFKEYEKKYIIEEERENAFYKNHLGRLGLVKICELLKPKICLISEFGEELRNHRIKIANIFNEAFKNKIVFLPADIELQYDFIKKKISAITEIDTDKALTKEELIEPKNVDVCLLRKDYSLHYFSKNATFTESDLIQVLIEKYDSSVK